MRLVGAFDGFSAAFLFYLYLRFADAAGCPAVIRVDPHRGREDVCIAGWMGHGVVRGTSEG